MRQLTNLIKLAFRSILKNRMRSLLTSLGIIIGVSAVIVMVAIGQGSQATIEENINALGTNLILIMPGSSSQGGVRFGAGSMKVFTLDDVTKIREGAADVNEVSPVVRTSGQVIGGSGNWNTAIFGVSPEYLDIRNWKVADGNAFTDRDMDSNKKVALIGQTIVDQLFPNQNPVGQRIRIRNIPFTIIGVLQAKGQNSMGQDQDDIILAPATTALYQLKGDRYIDMINASAVSPDKIPAAQDEIRTVLRSAHRLTGSEDDDFTIRTQSEITDAVSATSRTMTLLLGSIAAVSLIVGGIGIMNIMLVSVTERTREIGIRLSVGARGSDIMVQFLAEATVLSLTGGILGILLAAGVSMILNHYTALYLLISPVIITISFIFSGAIGIFFGFYPAKKAAALNPIDALRYE